MIIQVNILELRPHPDNRPLGINQEKVEQIAAMMQASGYDESKPIKARRMADYYQIIEGEHRWRAAEKAQIDVVPVFVIECDDEEALIQLVAGNVQTDNHPLDVGIAALKVTTRYSQSGKSAKDFGQRIGVSKDSISRYIRAAKVWDSTKSCTGATLKEIATLDEISKCAESDWLWFHNLIIQKDLSKADAIEISKRIREIDSAAGEYAARVYDLTAIKQECAIAKDKYYAAWVEIIAAVEECAAKLPDTVQLCRYNVTGKNIERYDYEARAVFLQACKDTKSLIRSDVFKHYNARLDSIRMMTIDQAEKDKKYFEDEENRAEAEERARAEWEAFIPQQGQWYELGPHRLYCGNNTDPAFINALPAAAFAFADPPYNAGVDEWDTGFKWQQDYLQEKADVIAVTPGGWQADSIYRDSKMNYVWELACWISNGMTHGKCGYANWIKVSIFSKPDIKPKIEQDFLKITINNSETGQTEHKGRKPYPLMEWLIKMFSKEADIIIDPFAGSGTTLLQCEKMGRVCFTAEINQEYCKDIMKRYKDEVSNT